MVLHLMPAEEGLRRDNGEGEGCGAVGLALVIDNRQ